MSNWLVGVVAVIYLAVAVDYARRGEWGFALTWFAYSVANVGLIAASASKGAS